MDNKELGSNLEPKKALINRSLISGVIAGIALTAIVVIAICLLINKNKDVTVVQDEPGSAQTQEVQQSSNQNQNLESSTVDAKGYTNSKFRVIGVFEPEKNDNPNIDLTINKIRFVVATDRSFDGSNDSQCGSIYTQANCYFYIEPLYIVDAPQAKYIGMLERPGAFRPDSVKFIEPNIVEFTTADGDAGYGFTQLWRLNLDTSEFIKLKRTEIEP